MSELEEAVKEWTAARKMFFAVSPVGMKPEDRFPADIWVRLGNAEHKLMQIGENL